MSEREGCWRRWPRIGGEMSEFREEVFRRLGVGPFILGILKRAVIQKEVAKRLLEQTPPHMKERIAYLQHVIEEGERMEKVYNEYTWRMKKIEEQLRREMEFGLWPPKKPGGERVIEAANVEQLARLVSENRLLLIDFYATWCMPCGWMAEALEKIREDLTRMGLIIIKVDVDKVDADEAARLLGLKEPIRGVPTLVVLRDGREIGRIVGARRGASLPEWLKRRIAEILQEEGSRGVSEQ